MIGSEPAAPPPTTTPETKPPEPAPTPAETSKPSLVAEPPKPEPLTVESLKFPEGSEVDPTIRDELLGVMNNAELDPKGRAQALVDLHQKALEQASEKASEFYRETRDKWATETRTEFGEKLNPALGDIAKLIDEYGGNETQRAELRDAFTMTGAGDHPGVVRLLHNVAKVLVAEGKILPGGGPSNAGGSAAERIFPNHPKG